MAKYVIGAIGALLGALTGTWLMLAPFALAYQGSGADWADPTYVDFWTGLPLLVISVGGLILYASGLVEELRRRGIIRRPYAAPPGPAPRQRFGLGKQHRAGPVTSDNGDAQRYAGARP